MIGLIKAIIILALFYYGFKFIIRLLAPLLLSRFIKKTQEHFYQHYRQDNPKEQEKETTIKSKKKQEKSNQDIGEYVDFEEID